MRAGLLSHPQVIRRINRQFVPTWIIVDDAQKLAGGGNSLARTVAGRWEFPLDVMFLSSEGEFINKLNSFEDLRAAHHDVGHPPQGRGRSRSHFEVFMTHVDWYFGKPGSADAVDN